MKRDKQTAELVERGTAALDKAVTTVTPYVEQAQAALAPALDEAKVGIDTAVHTVQDTLLPRLNDMVHDAAEAPATKEAVKRSRTAAAALRGEIEVSDATLDKLAGRRAKRAAKRNKAIAKEFQAVKKAVTDEVSSAKKKADKKHNKKSKKGRFGKFLLVTAIVGAVAVVVKQLLAAKKDDPWQSYEPSTFSGPTSTPAPTPPSATNEPAGPAAAAPVDDNLAAAAAGEATGDETSTTSPFGEGSYVGTEPPAGFDIKGNDRSMKYHERGSDSFERTIADVWFNSTEAAEAAGFTRAQR